MVLKIPYVPEKIWDFIALPFLLVLFYTKVLGLLVRSRRSIWVFYFPDGEKERRVGPDPWVIMACLEEYNEIVERIEIFPFDSDEGDPEQASFVCHWSEEGTEFRI